MSSPDTRDPRITEAITRYWKKNLTIMAILLLIWAAAGLGAGILFADTLNDFALGGIPLGFWFAQQGSIIVFVALVLVYAILLNRLDRQHHIDLENVMSAGDLGQGHQSTVDLAATTQGSVGGAS